jgi:hypothetical protein
MLDKTRHNHWLPRGLGTKHSRARKCPIITRHNDSTRDPVHKGARQSMSKWITLPRSLAPHPGRRSWATPAYIVQRDGMTHVSRHYSCVYQLQPIDRCWGSVAPPRHPHEGKRSDQASRSRWRHHKASWAPTMEGPRYRDNHITGRPPPDLKTIF